MTTLKEVELVSTGVFCVLKARNIEALGAQTPVRHIPWCRHPRENPARAAARCADNSIGIILIQFQYSVLPAVRPKELEVWHGCFPGE